MRIANCPTCATELEIHHIEEPITRLVVSLGILIVNASMMYAAMHDPRYALAREGFIERLNELSAIAEKDWNELQDWGEVYDGPDEDEAV